MFRKRLTEVSRADLEALIQTGAQEDRTLEFKETLSGRDGNADPWINDQTRIGNFAKRDLTKELIAFANTAGGTLILGMREDGEKRAAELVSLPQCRSLADRLLASIAASADPNLTALECVGVEIDGHHGVVVFRVPMSHLAPHRDKDERECYHRAGDKSEPMTMRQIQERSIASFRGSEQIVGSLNERADAFKVVQPNGVYVLVEGYANIPVKICGIRATAFPLQPIFIDSLSERRELALVLPSLRSLETQSGQHIAFSNADHPQWRPMLRGIRSREIPEEQEEFTQIIRADGLIEITRKVRENVRQGLGMAGVGLAVRHILYVFAQTLVRIEILRSIIGRPELEFTLDLDWLIPDGSKIVFPPNGPYSGITAATPIEKRNRVSDYEMVSRDRLPVLWEQIENDVAHSCGLQEVSRLRLDFEAAVLEGLARSKSE